jgi:eukaryotic-like serine/threonine-protein kinase
MHAGTVRATQGWARMSTQMATTAAEDRTLAQSSPSLSRGSMTPTLAPADRPRSVSVLPRIASEADGQIALHHEPAQRYRSVGVLGAGGMGVVERAEDIDIGRPVAIKRLLPEANHPLGVARFVGEIRIVGSLDHPNVVPIHDVGVDEQGGYFFVMKYVEGQTLADVIDRLAAGDPEAHAFWTFERRAELMIAVLQALEYAHERGVIHRDVKPENIMVGRHGEIRLMDWGIAKRVGVAEPGEEAGALIGTPAYMSPEQAACDELDIRSDLYSVSVTFHEFLALRHVLAHRSDTVVGLLAAVQEESPDVLALDTYDQTHQSIPPAELRYFCKHGLAKDRAQRFQSAGEMIATLRRFADGKTEVKCMYTATKRAFREGGRLVDRHPHVGVALAGLNISLVLTGLASLVYLAVG